MAAKSLNLAGGANITLSTATAANVTSVTISAAAPGTGGAETQTAISGISNSETMYTSGTVKLSGSNNVTVFSTTGQAFVISGPTTAAQTVQTQNLHNVTLSGNTSGALAAIFSGTMTLAGGNNITVSQAGNAITISGANVGGAQTGISGIQNSETTYTSGTVNLSAVGGPITIRSTTGQAFQFSVSQSVQAETQTFLSGIKNTETTYSSGQVELEGTNNITVFSTTGQRFRISGANTHAQQTGISAISNSNTTYTSGTVGLSELANITIRSTTGNQFQFSVAAQSVQAETQTFLSGIKNTETTYSSGQVELEGTNNITVFSTTGQRFRISGANTHAQQTGISAISNSNTTYTSGTVGLSELANITIRSTTGNQFQFSVAAQSVQAETQTFIGAIRNSETTYTSGTVNLSVVGGPLTIRSTTGNAFQFSASQSVQAETQTFLGALKNTETTYTSGTVELEGTNNITVFSTTGQRFRISGANTHAQQTGVSAIYDGANSISSGTVQLTDANGVTFSVNAQTLSASVNQSISMFAVSNTTQSSSGTAHKSALSFGGAGIASVGVTGGSVVVSVPSGGGAGDGGNTIAAGTRTATSSGSVLFENSNGVSFGLDAPSGTRLTGSVDGFSVGVSTMGGTAGSTGVTGTRMVWVGTDGLTLSQSTNTAGGTVTIDPGPLVGSFINLEMDDAPGTLSFTQEHAFLNVHPLNTAGPFPGVMTANTVLMRFFLSGSSATMSQANTSSFSLGLYTRNGSTLSLLNSATTTFGGAANANNSTSTVGTRWLSFHSSVWSSQPVLTRGEYYMAWNWRSSGVMNQSGGVWGQTIANSAEVGSGTMGVATVAPVSTMGMRPFYGRYSASTTAMPVSIGSNELNKSNVVGVHVPLMIFNQNHPQSF